MRTTIVTLILCGLLAACADSKNSEPPAASTDTEMSAGSEMQETQEPTTAMPASDPDLVAQRPDAEKLKSHMTNHIQYPATKAEIVAACAQTNEFTAAEQKWISETLPDGTYNSNNDVLQGLHMIVPAE